MVIGSVTDGLRQIECASSILATRFNNQGETHLDILVQMAEYYIDFPRMILSHAESRRAQRFFILTTNLH